MTSLAVRPSASPWCGSAPPRRVPTRGFGASLPYDRPVPSPADVSDSPEGHPHFTATTGRYRGSRGDGVIHVRGVRYATARRFRPPEPVTPTDRLVDATSPAPACPQPPSPVDAVLGNLYSETGFDEDCQRLSLTLPGDVRPGERLPVLVWIHGGSYVSGGGDLPIYDPTVLVREHRMVVVTVTFRLGVLGFLGDGPDRPANLGLLDLIAALRWVRGEVAAFGGDPDLVTLAGQSAGGDAIAHLLISDGAEGLFRRAIISSAPFGLRRHRARMTAAMARATGTLERTTPLPDLLAAQVRAERAALRFGLPGGMPFGTQYGRAPLPSEDRVRAEWRRAAERVDVLIGWADEETALFAEFIAPLRRVFELPGGGRAIRRRMITTTTDLIYRRPGFRFARLLAGAGGRVTRFELGWSPSRMGAAHTVDLPLLFPGPAWVGAPMLGGATLPDLIRLGAEFRRCVAEFAASGTAAPHQDNPIGLRMRRLLPAGRLDNDRSVVRR